MTSFLSDMNKPKLFTIGSFEAVLDCGYMHNRWLNIALGYLPEDFKNIKEEVVFISTATRDGCRIARHYCEKREIILISERVLPGGNVMCEDEPKARYFIYVVLHELAHAIKKHKSPLFDNLSDKEFECQEKEADDLAFEWFNNHVSKLGNLPLITKEEIKTAQEEQQEIMEKLRNGI